MNIKKNMLWIFYFAFVVIAIVEHDNEPVFIATGPYAAGKIVVWAVLIGFLAFSLYCSGKENFFRTMRTLYPYFWARQIGLDLYIGLLTPLFIIYLHSGSLLITALWFLPIFLFANLAVLLYLALNYQSLINVFVG